MGYFDEIMRKAACKASMRFGIFNEGDYYEPFEDYQILHCGKCHCKKEWIRFISNYSVDEIEQMKEEYAQKHPNLSAQDVHLAVMSIMPPKNRRNDMGKVGVPCQCQKNVIEGKARNERDDETRARIKNNKYDCFPASAMHQDNFKRWGYENKHLKAAKKYCDTFNEMYQKGQGLVLCGKAGAGKSIASICLANELLNREFTVCFKVQPEIILEDIEYRNAMFNKLIYCNVLVIDDLDLSVLNDYGREIMYYIIDARIKANKPIIVTSNITKAALENPSNPKDKRICDRLIEKCYIVEDSSHNYRRN